jgi:trypsin
LTAAHCQGAFNYGVLLYDPDTNDYTREATVDLQIRYPYFNGKDKHNDLLLLRLSKPTTDIKPAMMNRDDSMPTHDNNVMKAYGFGKTASDEPSSDALREGFFRYITNDECSERIRSTRTIIFDDVLCADPAFMMDVAETNTYDVGYNNDNGGSSICQGDSGGPLMDATSNLLLGVVSWNFLCEIDNLPDGFIRTFLSSFC